MGEKYNIFPLKCSEVEVAQNVNTSTSNLNLYL